MKKQSFSHQTCRLSQLWGESMLDAGAKRKSAYGGLDTRCSLKLPTVEQTDWHRKFKLMARKLLVGWFMECLVCKATFIRTTPENWTVGQRGKIFANDTRQQTSGQNTQAVKRNLITNERKFVGFVRCPDCLSGDVRLAEIGDEK